MTGANPTPVEVEASLLQNETREKDPQEMAAMLFTLYLPQFMARVDRLSSNALRRVLRAVIESPLNDNAYNFSSQQEKEVYAIAMNLLDAKYSMIIHSYTNGLEELAEAQKTSGTENEVVVESNQEKEVNNG